ncbi:MAG: hypothetical protein H7X77_09855 [Anaerolineae bacterium]|nr:hypothetical protein [Anaerolineae bacterium]
MLTSKPLLLIGIALSLIGAWLPFALPERGDPFDGMSMLNRFLFTSGGTTNTFNFGLFLPFIILTLAYGIAFWLVVRLSNDSQPLISIAGWLGVATAAHLLVMMLSIAQGMIGSQSDLVISPQSFMPGGGMVLFVLALPCLSARLVNCWSELRRIEENEKQGHLLERLRTLEKAAGLLKPL